MLLLGDLDLHEDHPLVSELSSLRKAVAHFQEEAHSSSIKLQGHSLASQEAQERTNYLEQENASLKSELSILRGNPHPDSAPQAHPAVAQVQQLTLSLRRLSDKFSLTEKALLERTTQLAIVTSDISKAKLAVDGAYELAARTRGREEEGKSKELMLEMKLKTAEEAAKMSDLVVREYAALVRSLEVKSGARQNGHSRSVSSLHSSEDTVVQGAVTLKDSLAEGKVGLQRLLAEFSTATERLQAELLQAQGELAVSKSKSDAEKKNLDQHLAELAKAKFELERSKLDDDSAAKMVPRYMKFSQQSTDTLQEALKTLAIRHKATSDTLYDQVSLLSSQVQFYKAQIKDISRLMDELTVEVMKESYGRRREVALRLRMINREEKIREDLERWIRRAEEGLARDAGNGEIISEKMIADARTSLSETLDGVSSDSPGPLARSIVVQNALDALVTELEHEKARRLEYEKAYASSQPGSHKKYRTQKGVDGNASEPTIPSTETSLSTTVDEGAKMPPASNGSFTSKPLPTEPILTDLESSPEHHLLPGPPSLPESTSQDTLLATEPVADSQSNARDLRTDGRTESFSLTPPPAPRPVSSLEASLPQDSEKLESKTTAVPSVTIIPLEQPIEHQEFENDGKPLTAQFPPLDSGSDSNEVNSPLPPLPQSGAPAEGDDNIATELTTDTDTGSIPKEQIPNERTLDSQTVPLGENALTESNDGFSPTSPFSQEIANQPPTMNMIPDVPHTDVPEVAQRTPHPLLVDLDKAKHRYDDLQRAFRDCYLALERLKESLSTTVDPTSPRVRNGPIPSDILRTAVQRLTDYTEDVRVELEIRIADEELMARGFETLLAITGALAFPIPPLSSDSNHDDGMDAEPSQSELISQIEGFISGEDASIQKAHRNFSRKLDDIQHDIAALKRAVHNTVTGGPQTPPGSDAAENAGSNSWVSWIRSPSTPSNLGSAAVLGAPTFGNVITSPHLRHSPSLNFPTHAHSGRRVFSDAAASRDPLASLGLKVPMPSFVSRQQPSTMQMQAQTPQRARTVSTMYMLGLGARSPGSSFQGSPASLQKLQRKMEPPPRLELDGDGNGRNSEGDAGDDEEDVE